MATSLNYYLKQLSSNYYLKNDSEELKRINSSIDNLFKNLDKDLEYLMKKRFIFGSFDRDTILPRKYDSNSDIDIMVVFNHTEYERTPETYRNWLKHFADKYYKDRYGSEVIKTFPTVTLKLNNIKYDLVPAKEEITFYSSQLYIPGEYGWVSTNPNDVKANLINVNKKYDNIVRPIIRLLKAWNSKAGNPLSSYDLELQITQMNFFNDDIEKGFFWAARRLNIPYGAAKWKKDELNKLSSIISQIETYLENDNSLQAIIEIHKILPYS